MRLETTLDLHVLLQVVVHLHISYSDLNSPEAIARRKQLIDPPKLGKQRADSHAEAQS